MASLENVHALIQQASVIARGKSIQRRKSRNPEKPSAKWIADARIGDKRGKALAIVLNTIGCSHAQSEQGGCTMCSYLLDGSGSDVTSFQLQKQFDDAIDTISDIQEPMSVKIYTSGSFLDPAEVQGNARHYILECISNDERIVEVIIESRPEYITEDSVVELRSVLGDRRIELGIGVESSNDRIRQICINKGYTTSDFKRALDIAKLVDIGTRAYVLLKPPFLTERDAIIDAKRTIIDAVELGVTTISINPINIQKNTLVEYLWERGGYRTPWLWSLIDVIVDTRAQVKQFVNIVCDPVASGKTRGVHNCGSCDASITQAIRDFSLRQDASVLSSLDCVCKETWHQVLVHEDISLLSLHNPIIDY